MTRTARMAKKKHLDATPWEEMRVNNQDKQKGAEDVKEEITNDNKSQIHKKRKVRKRESNNNEDEEMLSSKKSKMASNNDSETTSTVKKEKKLKKLKDDHPPEAKSKSIPSETSETATVHRKEKKKKLKNVQSMDIESKIADDVEVKVKSKNVLKRISKDSTIQAQEHNKHSGTMMSRKEQKLEKQREARRRRRAKQKGITCFHCRQSGHTTATCPKTNNGDCGVGVCYKCGSSDHTTKNCGKDTSKDENPFPFAKCFICEETGHLSRACPDNPKGLYPKGGGCNLCGSVEHLKRDCPENIKPTKADVHVKSGTSLPMLSKYTSADSEVIPDDDTRHTEKTFKKAKEKVVKF